MNVANRFINRLTKIGIDVELTGNYPWVYLWKVNGVSVNKTYMAEHGFTAFWQQKNSHLTHFFLDISDLSLYN